MVTGTVMEQVVQALARGEGVSAIARAYGLDRKTVRAWGRRGGYVGRAARPVVSQLDPYWADGL
jgi:transposase-like protein